VAAGPLSISHTSRYSANAQRPCVPSRFTPGIHEPSIALRVAGVAEGREGEPLGQLVSDRLRAGFRERGQAEVGRHELAGGAVVVGVVGQEHAELVAEREAGDHDAEAA